MFTAAILNPTDTPLLSVREFSGVFESVTRDIKQAPPPTVEKFLSFSNYNGKETLTYRLISNKLHFWNGNQRETIFVKPSGETLLTLEEYGLKMPLDNIFFRAKEEGVKVLIFFCSSLIKTETHLATIDRSTFQI